MNVFLLKTRSMDGNDEIDVHFRDGASQVGAVDAAARNRRWRRSRCCGA